MVKKGTKKITHDSGKKQKAEVITAAQEDLRALDQVNLALKGKASKKAAKNAAKSGGRGPAPPPGASPTPGEEEGGTTVMLRNIPKRYTPILVLDLLNHLGFHKSCDTLHVPIDPLNGRNYGYAVVNLVNHEEAQRLKVVMRGWNMWLYEHNVCEVVPCTMSSLEVAHGGTSKKDNLIEALQHEVAYLTEELFKLKQTCDDLRQTCDDLQQKFQDSGSSGGSSSSSDSADADSEAEDKQQDLLKSFEAYADHLLSSSSSDARRPAR